MFAEKKFFSITVGLFKKSYASNVIHTHLISIGTMLYVQMQVIRFGIKVVQLIWYQDK